MYRVLITGDTHGHIQSVLDLMENVEFDEVIHLGDYVKDAAAIGNIYKEIPVHFVRGNNDFSGENEKVITIAGRKIFICHGHTLGVGTNLLKISLAAREKGALIALHGHTRAGGPDGKLGSHIFARKPDLSENERALRRHLRGGRRLF